MSRKKEITAVKVWTVCAFPTKPDAFWSSWACDCHQPESSVVETRTFFNSIHAHLNNLPVGTRAAVITQTFLTHPLSQSIKVQLYHLPDRRVTYWSATVSKCFLRTKIIQAGEFCDISLRHDSRSCLSEMFTITCHKTRSSFMWRQAWLSCYHLWLTFDLGATVAVWNPAVQLAPTLVSKCSLRHLTQNTFPLSLKTHTKFTNALIAEAPVSKCMN